jgi:AAA+ ATPase superfamily predicted ATPase
MILKFINREKELCALEAAYRSSKPEFFLIYGRRRIGKTELVKRFVEGKPHLYFMAKEQPVEQEIERLGERFSEKFNVHIKASKDVDNVFSQIIAKVDPKEKFILVIDEFPFWVKKHRPILSEFQHLWDERLTSSNLLLILLGSSVSMMEDELLSYNSPLYGRRTGQLKVEPMGPAHLKGFLPSYDLEDLIKVYGAVGGVPFYLKEFEDKKSVLENIKSTFLNKSNILYEEAEILLREELREVTVYFNIMKAITDGATRPGEIANKAYVNITNISKYLNTLNTLGFITKETAITESVTIISVSGSGMFIHTKRTSKRMSTGR